MIDWIAFDADDTLWENEAYYYRAQETLYEILKPFQPEAVVETELLKTETQNIPVYGYGLKSFGLSMIETAIRLSAGGIGIAEIQRILDMLHEMVNTTVEVLPGVHETLQSLNGGVRMLVITKGDLIDQERKLSQSGLAQYFEAFEIVSNKDETTYLRLLQRYGIPIQRMVMVGNSLKSDVLPVVRLGGRGVLVPHHTTWAHEHVPVETAQQHAYDVLERITELPGLIQTMRE
ncbi:MAG: haloacid dehalogenase [Chloroflexi bacterium HGW-Chloroflexi-10]|nr:MAG: haloacid dehalogenase [Chloroflexi bacterium HGW-Chloroflexi-10]